MTYVIGVDVGGTFTDAVLDDDTGQMLSAKVPSTPGNYADGVVNALEALAEQLETDLDGMLAQTHHIAHGTTSSLNALVMGLVPQVGFLTTQGHGDSIFIMNVEGRYLGASPHELQDVLGQHKDHSLLSKKYVLEVPERIDRDGNVVVPLDEDAVRAAVRGLLDLGVRSIAVSLLWSFKNPAHEQRIREIIAEIDPEVYVALSSEVSPRIREFARHSTTIMSAQIAPGLREYLGDLETRLRQHGLSGALLVMQSNGGAVAAGRAHTAAMSTIGSVLTGGLVGAESLGRQLAHRNIISTDVGGTTFLVGLIVDGEPVRRSTTVINRHPINVPSLHVEAIGAGGGAIAWIDPGGNLRVGPRSAQADPGPACYGQGGDEPTNTDANLVLGILPESGLLGGKKALDMGAARAAIKAKIADPLGLTVEQAAAAIYAIQTAQTADLLRKTVVESGYDPRNFVLYAFGGAGPSYCAAYAGEVGIHEVVIPLGPVASAFSAYGLLSSNVVLTAEMSDPGFMPVDPAHAQSNFEQLEAQVRAALAGQGLNYASIEIVRSIDMRYTMQLAEIEIALPDGPIDADSVGRLMADYEKRYAELYGEGTGFSAAGVQGITYRVRATGILPFSPELPLLPQSGTHDPSKAQIGTRSICLDARLGYQDTPVYDYQALRAGHILVGPAVIQVPTTTVVIPPGMTGTVDTLGNLSIVTKEN